MAHSETDKSIFEGIADRMKIALSLIIGLSIIAGTGYSATFPTNTKYEVCFTLGSDCTSLIVKQIQKANRSIYAQAYSFTSTEIAKAIANAKKKGMHVGVILDKSQMKNNSYSAAKYLSNQGVPVWIDYKPAIAHNKVFIIDNSTVITGSFNFTKAAQDRNAENVLIIHDVGLANLYLHNWESRQTLSIKVENLTVNP